MGSTCAGGKGGDLPSVSAYGVEAELSGEQGRTSCLYP